MDVHLSGSRPTQSVRSKWERNGFRAVTLTYVLWTVAWGVWFIFHFAKLSLAALYITLYGSRSYFSFLSSIYNPAHVHEIGVVCLIPFLELNTEKWENV